MGSNTGRHCSMLSWAVYVTLLLLGWDEATAVLEGPGQRLSPSGQVLLKRCQDSLRDNDTVAAYPGHTDGPGGEGMPGAGTEAGAKAGQGEAVTERGLTDQQGPAGKWLRWRVPTLPFSLSPHHSDFGWVQTLGQGVHEASVGVRTCFSVAVMTKAGQAFDRSCLQRVAFMANMSSVEAVEGLTGRQDMTKRLAPAVTYIPHTSMHEVCYVAPTPGFYRMDISLLFTNAFEVMTSRDRSSTQGYVNYTTAISTQVFVTGPRRFSLVQQRKGLPECTLQILASSKVEGFWVGDVWMPAACRIRHLEPTEMMKCLDRKSVLFLGDSEMRYTYGVLQTFLSKRSRDEYLTWIESRSWHPGSLLEGLRLPGKAYDGDTLTMQPFVTRVNERRYNVSTGEIAFFGGRYEGYGVQHLRSSAPSLQGGARGDSNVGTSVDANLTYVSFFKLPQPLIPNWMLHGSQAGGVKAGPGRFDLVLEGTLLHSVKNYDSKLEYGDALNSTYIPKLKKFCPKGKCTLVSFGAWVGDESRKPRMVVGFSNNLRQHALEEEGYEVFRSQGFPNSLPLWSLTAPQRGGRHSVDPVHYRAPVTLAMIDMVFGSLCSNSAASAH